MSLQLKVVTLLILCYDGNRNRNGLGVNNVAQSSYIKLVEGSVKQSVTLDELKAELKHYIEMTSKTGQQLQWGYAEAAFPYTIEQKPEGEGKWFYLKGKDPKLYKYILIGVGQNEDGTSYVQLTLPDDSTHGDKGKANELCRYFAKHFKAQLVLFNGRIQYFNPRK